MFPLPVLFKALLLFITIDLSGVPIENSVISKILWHRKEAFTIWKAGRRIRREREKRETDKVRTDRGAGMGRKCAEWRMHVGERVKERGKRVCGGRDGEDKGWAVFPDVVSVRCSSQLLLQGLLHLHFNLKIAPVIIYLAWARHPALCFLRIDFSLSESLWDSSSLFSPLQYSDDILFISNSLRKYVSLKKKNIYI